MRTRNRADHLAKMAWRRWRRLRRRRSNVARVFETAAALLPSLVLVFHLALRAEAGQPAPPEAAPVTLARDSGVTSGIVAVPEPSSFALLVLGAGALLLQRRRRSR